jgi:hypothetical protein
VLFASASSGGIVNDLKTTMQIFPSSLRRIVANFTNIITATSLGVEQLMVSLQPN